MLKEIAPLTPSQFFKMSCRVPYAKEIKLPDTSTLVSEESFATLSVEWNERGLRFVAEIKSRLKESSYPRVQEGDSVELFIDTRNMKSAGSITPFCHHFVFLPLPVDDIRAAELTKFRGEESRPMAQPYHFEIDVKEKLRTYTMDILISPNALYGFDPYELPHLGFTYRINRCHAEPQHFACTGRDAAIERSPSLWGTLILEK